MPARGSRRRAGWLALLAVLVAGLAIPMLRTPPQADLDDRTAPEPMPVAPDIGPVARPVVYDIDFADERQGFALRARCTDGSSYLCIRQLLVTKDGLTWTTRSFGPAAQVSADALAGRVTALGAGRLVVSDLVDGAPAVRFFSGDGGRTWQETSARPDATVDAIPPDGRLDTDCVDTIQGLAACRLRRLVVVLPDSGNWAWLANPPSLDQPTPEPLAAADGSWWVSGKEPSTGRWAVAVSRDSGRSWSVTPLPTESGEAVDRVSVAGAGRHVYAAATGSLPDVREPRSLISLFQSTDGGHSWVRTRRADGTPPRSVGGSPIVTPDGALFLAADDVGPGYRSVNGGRTFTAALDGPRLTSVRRTRAGYLAVASGGSPGRYLTSTDGVTWTPVLLPSQ